jgi:hypothetical protein
MFSAGNGGCPPKRFAAFCGSLRFPGGSLRIASGKIRACRAIFAGFFGVLAEL